MIEVEEVIEAEEVSSKEEVEEAEVFQISEGAVPEVNSNTEN